MYKRKGAEKNSQTKTTKTAEKAATAARQPNDWQANPPPQTSATRTCTSAVVGDEATGNNSGNECSTASVRQMRAAKALRNKNTHQRAT
jgi:hypothetical protein